MADPKQKSLELPRHLTRILPLWQTPQWMEAERWRRIVYNQPVAMICRDVLAADLVAADWEIRSRNPREEDLLAEDIKAYTDILNVDLGNAIIGFDPWIEKGIQDLVTLPVGWNNEILRWPDGMGPFSRPHPKGHVYRIFYLDGATIYPTLDRDFPMAQRIKQRALDVIYFARNEIARAIMSPRPELERWGYGMPPPEKIYLAISLLFRGDQYYANLLLDTPEAGVLDLADMSQKTAKEWVQSFRTLFEGIDPMKIGVLYEHEKPIQYVAFGRPPTEMMFNATTLKYTQITAAGYGLTLTDIGLGDPHKTLAGSIRDERRSRRSGFATVREKVRTLIQTEILPPYLQFIWIERDEEAAVQKGRAFVLAAQGLKMAKEAGFISQQEGQAQLKEGGHLTIEVEPPDESILPAARSGNGNHIVDEMRKIPASQGGRGDLTGKAELGDERIAAAPKDSAKYDQMAMILRRAFSKIIQNADRPRLLKLIKAATRALFPIAAEAMKTLSDIEIPLWLEQRALFWFKQKSEFDDLPDVRRVGDDILDILEELLNGDQWWIIPAEIADNFLPILQLAYEEGAIEAANMIQEFLYIENLVDSPDIIGLNFNLANPITLARLEKSAAQLVTRVNDGSKFYLKRILTSGVEEGLSSPSIARMIRDGADVETILKEAGFTEAVIKRAQEEIGEMTESRLNSIVNTEVARAETEGRVDQWRKMGLTRKRWAHTGGTGDGDPCPICQENIALGFVSIKYKYDSVFGKATITGPPAHPQVDHCHIEFDENELTAKAGELNIWAGD